MANLRDIRNRIETVKSTQQITKAMKMVAAARLKKAQDRVIAARPYATKLKTVLGKLAVTSKTDSRYMNAPSGSGNVLLIVIGSDRGLCGGFNSNLFRFVEDELQSDFAEALTSKRLHIVTVGRKAHDFFKKRGYEVVGSNNGFFDKLSFEHASHIIRNATDAYLDGTYDQVLITFNEFKSVISQNKIMEHILPVPTEEIEESHLGNLDYIFEPSSHEILDRIIPLYLNTQFWKAILESNASEQGARMAAMDNATENASEIIRELRLKYNQARQAAITTEISEIVSGAEALKG